MFDIRPKLGTKMAHKAFTATTAIRKMFCCTRRPVTADGVATACGSFCGQESALSSSDATDT